MPKLINTDFEYKEDISADEAIKELKYLEIKYDIMPMSKIGKAISKAIEALRRTE